MQWRRAPGPPPPTARSPRRAARRRARASPRPPPRRRAPRRSPRAGWAWSCRGRARPARARGPCSGDRRRRTSDAWIVDCGSWVVEREQDRTLNHDPRITTHDLLLFHCRALDFLYRVLEIVHALEAAIDRGEAYVGDLVELAQLAHHHAAEAPRVHLALAQRQHILRDGRYGLVHHLRRHRPLVQRPHEAGAELVEVELGTAAVLLHHLRHPQLDRLVGGEALAAGRALAPAPDAVPFVAHPRVDDLRVGGRAERALHSDGGWRMADGGWNETKLLPFRHSPFAIRLSVYKRETCRRAS